MLICTLLGSLVLHVCVGYKTLNLLSYTQLPTSVSRGVYVYGGVNLGTATAAAYDFHNNIVYVIGATSHFMHVIDIVDPSNPVTILTHEFTKGEGVPQSIDICENEIAVGLSSQTDVNEGHVRFYHAYARGSGATDVVIDGYVTDARSLPYDISDECLLLAVVAFYWDAWYPVRVNINGLDLIGPHPNHLRYTSDCGTVIVSNEGRAGKDVGGAYTNPEGSITIIHGERTGNPSVRMVDFSTYNLGEINYNANLRAPSLYIPTSTLATQTTVAQDIEPENVAISKDAKTAWVSLQENNAIVEIALDTGVIRKVSPLPKKDWSNKLVDVSDRDGGVHRRMYTGLHALRQPGVMVSLEIGNKQFLFTGDEGAEKSYTNALHGFTWTDKATARSIYTKIDPIQAELKSNASNDEYLGRLGVSNVDGKNPFNQMYEHLEMFGGRGISIWDSSTFGAPVFDSEDTFEQYMEDYDKQVFNTNYLSSTATYQSPEITRDASSYQKGAAVTGLDVADDNGTVYLVAGTSTTGTLYLYTVDTSSGQPVPQFQSIVRNGLTDLPWAELYTTKSLGDLYISDIGIITSEHSPLDRPLLYVSSTGAGSLSIYEIVDANPIIPGPN